MTPIDFNWLIEACGEDRERLEEVALLISAGGTLTKAFASNELHLARMEGYRAALVILSRKLGYEDLATGFENTSL